MMLIPSKSLQCPFFTSTQEWSTPFITAKGKVATDIRVFVQLWSTPFITAKGKMNDAKSVTNYPRVTFSASVQELLTSEIEVNDASSFPLTSECPIFASVLEWSTPFVTAKGKVTPWSIMPLASLSTYFCFALSRALVRTAATKTRITTGIHTITASGSWVALPNRWAYMYRSSRSDGWRSFSGNITKRK